jgi:hypothetical protein
VASLWFGPDDLEKYCGGPLPVKAFTTGLEHMLAALQRQRVRMFVANLPDMRLVPATALGGDTNNALRGDRYNAIVADLVKRHGAILVDIRKATRSLYTRPAYQTGPDFNARGEAVLARLFYQVMHVHGALWRSLLSLVPPSIGINLPFPVFAAVIIGGASLAAGRGTVLGTLLGTLLLATLADGLSLPAVDPFVQSIFVGSVTIIAVALDRWANVLRTSTATWEQTGSQSYRQFRREEKAPWKYAV